MVEGGLHVLVPLLKSTDVDTITAAVAALRNLSIRKGNEVRTLEDSGHNTSKKITYSFQYNCQPL